MFYALCTFMEQLGIMYSSRRQPTAFCDVHWFGICLAIHMFSRVDMPLPAAPQSSVKNERNMPHVQMPRCLHQCMGKSTGLYLQVNHFVNLRTIHGSKKTPEPWTCGSRVQRRFSGVIMISRFGIGLFKGITCSDSLKGMLLVS